MNTIEIIRTSASRPDLLEETTALLLKHLKFSGELIWHIHEDFLSPERSNQCIHWAKYSGVYHTTLKDLPPVGQGASLTKLLDLTSSKYIFNCEDDFGPVRDVDLDLAVYLMEKGENINQICFNKRQTMTEKPGFQKKEVEIEGHKLTTNPHWALIPALWRADWIKARWVSFNQGCHWDLNDKLKGGGCKVLPAEWVIENTGTYYMGGIGEYQYMKHFGFMRSLREVEEQKGWK